MIRLNASLSYIAKLSKTMKWLKIKMPLSCQNCPVIDGRLTVECPYCRKRYDNQNAEILSMVSLSTSPGIFSKEIFIHRMILF